MNLEKKHPAPHVSKATGKHRCKSSNTIIKQKVHGELDSAVKSYAEKQLKIFSEPPKTSGNVLTFVSVIRQKKKTMMVKIGLTGKSFKRKVKQLKRLEKTESDA
jgi:hypothetical protein